MIPDPSSSLIARLILLRSSLPDFPTTVPGCGDDGAMTTYAGTNEFEGATFVKASFKGATLRFSDLSGVTMRSVDVDGLDIDSHDLFFGSLVVNGVDVVPLVDAELNRQFPGRELQKAQTPEGLREALITGGAVAQIPRSVSLC